MSYYPPSPQRFDPGAPRARKRSTTGLWALATFSALLLCCGATLLVVAMGGQLPNLGSDPSWTPLPQTPTLPPVTPMAVEQPVRSPDSPFLAGDKVANVSGGPVNLRSSPGYQGQPADDIIATVPAGISGVVADGPQFADGLRWWYVRFPQGDGWVAERSSSGKVLFDLAP